MEYRPNDIIKIDNVEYILGDEVLLDASNLEMGETYIEHTQIKPDRFSIHKKTCDTETVENSWKIKIRLFTINI